MEKKSNRNLYYDVIRVIAMFLVIGVHAVGSIEQNAGNDLQRAFVSFLERINNLGVPTFFALSGVLILSREYKDIWGFYKNRLIRIGIPYCVYATLYVCYFTGYEEKNVLGIPLAFVRDILTANVHPTHWFVYSIIGIYFASPFLSRMFHSTNDSELKILLGGCLILSAICNVFDLFQLSFGVKDILFNSGNLFMFIGGYSFNRLEKSDKAGILRHNLLLSAAFLVLYLVTDRSFLGQLAIMLTMIDSGICDTYHPDNALHRMITAISKHSYSVYLIHAAVISMLLMICKNWNEYFIIKCILIYFVVFIVSYSLVRIIDFLITDRLIEITICF
ncbi:MAG: acyltransferase [Lachnospiraceae bacterium]|nr:acyltransferase [Lachnospiraceae bacterium]